VRLAIVSAALLTLFSMAAWAADKRDVPAPPAAASSGATETASAPVPDANKPLASLPAEPAPAAAVPPTPAAPLADGTLPSPPLAVITVKKPPQPHRFLDARNSLGLAALAATLSSDALSTQRGLAYPRFHEMNPIARPFVQTRAGGAAYSAGSFALLATTMYVAHRTRRHKLERILPFAIAGWEGWLSARNYRVIAASKR